MNQVSRTTVFGPSKSYFYDLHTWKSTSSSHPSISIYQIVSNELSNVPFYESSRVCIIVYSLEIHKVILFLLREPEEYRSPIEDFLYWRNTTFFILGKVDEWFGGMGVRLWPLFNPSVTSFVLPSSILIRLLYRILYREKMGVSSKDSEKDLVDNPFLKINVLSDYEHNNLTWPEKLWTVTGLFVTLERLLICFPSLLTKLSRPKFSVEIQLIYVYQKTTSRLFYLHIPILFK